MNSGGKSKHVKAKSKNKFSALDINSTFEGKSFEAKYSSRQRHGFQTLGKVRGIQRIPQPTWIPSMQSESGMSSSVMTQSFSESSTSEMTSGSQSNTTSQAALMLNWRNVVRQSSTVPDEETFHGSVNPGPPPSSAAAEWMERRRIAQLQKQHGRSSEERSLSTSSQPSEKLHPANENIDTRKLSSDNQSSDVLIKSGPPPSTRLQGAAVPTKFSAPSSSSTQANNTRVPFAQTAISTGKEKTIENEPILSTGGAVVDITYPSASSASMTRSGILASVLSSGTDNKMSRADFFNTGWAAMDNDEEETPLSTPQRSNVPAPTETQQQFVQPSNRLATENRQITSLTTLSTQKEKVEESHRGGVDHSVMLERESVFKDYSQMTSSRHGTMPARHWVPHSDSPMQQFHKDSLVPSHNMQIRPTAGPSHSSMVTIGPNSMKSETLSRNHPPPYPMFSQAPCINPTSIYGNLTHTPPPVSIFSSLNNDPILHSKVMPTHPGWPSGTLIPDSGMFHSLPQPHRMPIPDNHLDRHALHRGSESPSSSETEGNSLASKTAEAEFYWLAIQRARQKRNLQTRPAPSITPQKEEKPTVSVVSEPPTHESSKEYSEYVKKFSGKVEKFESTPSPERRERENRPISFNEKPMEMNDGSGKVPSLTSEKSETVSPKISSQDHRIRDNENSLNFKNTGKAKSVTNKKEHYYSQNWQKHGDKHEKETSHYDYHDSHGRYVTKGNDSYQAFGGSSARQNASHFKARGGARHDGQNRNTPMVKPKSKRHEKSSDYSIASTNEPHLEFDEEEYIGRGDKEMWLDDGAEYDATVRSNESQMQGGRRRGNMSKGNRGRVFSRKIDTNSRPKTSGANDGKYMETNTSNGSIKCQYSEDVLTTAHEPSNSKEDHPITTTSSMPREGHNQPKTEVVPLFTEGEKLKLQANKSISGNRGRNTELSSYSRNPYCNYDKSNRNSYQRSNKTDAYKNQDRWQQPGNYRDRGRFSYAKRGTTRNKPETQDFAVETNDENKIAKNDLAVSEGNEEEWETASEGSDTVGGGNSTGSGNSVSTRPTYDTDSLSKRQNHRNNHPRGGGGGCGSAGPTNRSSSSSRANQTSRSVSRSNNNAGGEGNNTNGKGNNGTKASSANNAESSSEMNYVTEQKNNSNCDPLVGRESESRSTRSKIQVDTSAFSNVVLADSLPQVTEEELLMETFLQYDLNISALSGKNSSTEKPAQMDASLGFQEVLSKNARRIRRRQEELAEKKKIDRPHLDGKKNPKSRFNRKSNDADGHYKQKSTLSKTMDSLTEDKSSKSRETTYKVTPLMDQSLFRSDKMPQKGTNLPPRLASKKFGLKRDSISVSQRVEHEEYVSSNVINLEGDNFLSIDSWSNQIYEPEPNSSSQSIRSSRAGKTSHPNVLSSSTLPYTEGIVHTDSLTTTGLRTDLKDGPHNSNVVGMPTSATTSTNMPTTSVSNNVCKVKPQKQSAAPDAVFESLPLGLSLPSGSVGSHANVNIIEGHNSSASVAFLPVNNSNPMAISTDALNHSRVLSITKNEDLETLPVTRLLPEGSESTPSNVNASGFDYSSHHPHTSSTVSLQQPITDLWYSNFNDSYHRSNKAREHMVMSHLANTSDYFPGKIDYSSVSRAAESTMKPVFQLNRFSENDNSLTAFNNSTGSRTNNLPLWNTPEAALRLQNTMLAQRPPPMTAHPISGFMNSGSSTGNASLFSGNHMSQDHIPSLGNVPSHVNSNPLASTLLQHTNMVRGNSPVPTIITPFSGLSNQTDCFNPILVGSNSASSGRNTQALIMYNTVLNAPNFLKVASPVAQPMPANHRPPYESSLSSIPPRLPHPAVLLSTGINDLYSHNNHKEHYLFPPPQLTSTLPPTSGFPPPLGQSHQPFNGALGYNSMNHSTSAFLSNQSLPRHSSHPAIYSHVQNTPTSLFPTNFPTNIPPHLPTHSAVGMHRQHVLVPSSHMTSNSGYENPQLSALAAETFAHFKESDMKEMVNQMRYGPVAPQLPMSSQPPSTYSRAPGGGFRRQSSTHQHYNSLPMSNSSKNVILSGSLHNQASNGSSPLSTKAIITRVDNNMPTPSVTAQQMLITDQ